MCVLVRVYFFFVVDLLIFNRDQCGVGIVFHTNIEGALEVADVLSDGPADKCGLIKHGE